MQKRIRNFTAYADGACEPNPGAASFGVIVEDVDGGTIYRLSKAIGAGTNNIAEWRGALAALDWLIAHGSGHVELRMDSKLVVNQLTGRWRVKTATLEPLAAEGRRLLAALRARGVTCDVQWIPRSLNRADEIASQPDAGGIA